VLEALTRLFHRRDWLTRLSRQTDRSAFVRCLLETEVVVLAALHSEGLDAASFTQEELLAEIERAAQDLEARDSFEPFVYEAEGSLRLPFFSTPHQAQVFCAGYSQQHSRVFPFQTLTVRGIVLTSLLPACDALVLNAGTPDEYVLTEAELDLLRAG
jgi:hypothetical protein